MRSDVVSSEQGCSFNRTSLCLTEDCGDLALLLGSRKVMIVPHGTLSTKPIVPPELAASAL
jgi:hypothetical protein